MNWQMQSSYIWRTRVLQRPITLIFEPAKDKWCAQCAVLPETPPYANQMKNWFNSGDHPSFREAQTYLAELFRLADMPIVADEVRRLSCPQHRWERIYLNTMGCQLPSGRGAACRVLVTYYHTTTEDARWTASTRGLNTGPTVRAGTPADAVVKLLEFLDQGGPTRRATAKRIRALPPLDEEIIQEILDMPQRREEPRRGLDL